VIFADSGHFCKGVLKQGHLGIMLIARISKDHFGAKGMAKCLLIWFQHLPYGQHCVNSSLCQTFSTGILNQSSRVAMGNTCCGEEDGFSKAKLSFKHYALACLSTMFLGYLFRHCFTIFVPNFW
jgi:hypothetical protein